MSKYVLKLRIVSPDDRLNDLYKEAVNKMNTEEYLMNPLRYQPHSLCIPDHRFISRQSDSQITRVLLIVDIGGI